MSCHSPTHTININNNNKTSENSSKNSSKNSRKNSYNNSSNNSSNNNSNNTKESMSSSCSSCSPSSSPSKNSTPLNNDSWNIIKNPVNGRTRISQACDRCRARKIKCSGKSENNPRCTNCEKDGFQCIVSDKLTRNSFPKGYTKNLEKKLLDVELDRNRILLELNQLKEKLNNDNNDNYQNNYEVSINNNGYNNGHNNSSNNGYNNNYNRQYNKIDNDKSRPHQIVRTDQNGLINLQQSIITPFNSFIKHLKINSFNGYELNKNNQFQQQSNLSNFAAAVSSANDHIDSHSKSLSNYHMNLNRYLNLILYKLIFPLFNLNSNSTSTSNAAASSNSNSNSNANANSNLNSNSKSNPNSNRNLDHLIWLFFNDYNKLIPILDFELFYNDYLTFINNYTLKNSTFLENGEIKKRYHEFNLKDQDILIKLILILKFTLSQPKAQENSLNSIALPDKKSLNQLDESIKLINVKHLTLMFKNINFLIEPNLDKFEISLLMFYYLIKFENYNLPIFSDTLHSNIEFLRDIININKFLLNILNINKSNNLLIIKKQSHDQLIKIQRLKLYWDYKILIKLSEIYFNCQLDDEIGIDNHQMDNEKSPASLETIKLINNDIEITLSLVNLLNLIPLNIMKLVISKDKEKLTEIDENLKSWKLKIDKISSDDNNIVLNKLNSYYGYFKILINWHDQSSINKTYYIDFVNLVYDLTLNNNNIEISIETAENLCLHSFNFHFILLLSIIKLKNLINDDNKTNNEDDKNLIIKLSKLIQLYQILVNVKDVDPTIEVLVNYIKDNINFNDNDGDGDLNQLDTLKLFTSMNSSDINISNRTSLFDKKSYQKGSHTNSNISFDLNAFHLPGDLCYSSTDDDASTKRRKSNASTSSVISSNLSLGSRESSVTSARRISISSNDSNIPSLFPSATSPFPANDHNPSEKKRRTYEFPLQLTRPTRVRSMSADSRLRLRSRSITSVDMNNPRDLNSITRSNSINNNNNNNNNNINSMNSNMCQRANSESGTLPINSTHDLVSSILYNDDDLNLRMDRRSNNCQFPQILPTIPSEGNLFKAMSAVTDSLMDVDSSVNLEVESTNNQFDVVDSFFNKNGIDNSVLNNNSDSDFSKAFTKSPMTITTTPLSMDYNETSRRRGPSFVDDEDLLKLKEKVMNMKTSIH